jgi:DNA-binding NarL/FixJ family response regulator
MESKRLDKSVPTVPLQNYVCYSESAAEFVQEAFRIGVMAYVTKIRARKELPAAVEAVPE